MKQRKYNPKPNSNLREAPETAQDVPDGKILIWFKGPNEDPPEEYDYSVSHRSKPGWRVYFLLVCILAVPLCCIARLVATFLEGG